MKINTRAFDFFGLDGKKTGNDCFQAEILKYLHKDPKLIAVFDDLKKYQHVILTNADLILTLAKLKLLGLKKNIFSHIFTTYDLPFVKPDPQVFSYIMQKLKVAPNQIMSIGDRVETDLLPAKQVGMKTCLVWEKSPEIDVSVDSVYKVQKLFV